MTNEQWKQLHIKANEISELAKDYSSEQWFKMVDIYYTEELDEKNKELTRNLERMLMEFKRDQGNCEQ